MYIQQLYTNCLAHAAYYVESDGEALVIDPLRDPEPYLQLARERKASIRYILETHFHADFVSGHLDLAKKTGASIILGPDANPGYDAVIASDHQIFPLGEVEFEVLHTPGHTIESACFLLYDETGKPHCLFSGDTLFVNEVGRPDLMSGSLSKEELGGLLYHSLNDVIKNLPDDVIVYPGHGAGSACGKNIGKETFSTIGEQKKTNYALQASTKEAFVHAVASDLPTPPDYFFKAAALNKSGYASYDDVMEHNFRALDVNAFAEEMKKGTTVLDTRAPGDFCKAFIPDALNIGIDGDFAVWAGTIIRPGTRLLLVTEPGREREAITRLSRIGFDQVAGFLEGGIESWVIANKKTDSIPSVEPEALPQLVASGKYVLLDVRRPAEVEKEKLKGSVHIALSALRTALTDLDANEQWLVYCAGGYRSVMAASLLKANGFKNVVNISGGITHVKQKAPELLV